MADVKKNSDGGRKRSCCADNEDINEPVYKRYYLATERNIPISGPRLQEEALQIVKTIDPEKKLKVSTDTSSSR